MDQDNWKLSECSNIERQEQRLREQLNEACRLARDLDERVKSIPAGKLCAAGGISVNHAPSAGDQATAAAGASCSCTSTQLRSAIAIATSDVVAAFNEAVRLLLQSSYTSDHSAALSAANSSPPQALYSSPRQKMSSISKAINVLAGEHRSLVQMKSPPLSPCSRPSHHRQQVNMTSATATPSPPRCTIHSPLLSAATSEMSDGSPTPKPHLLQELPADEVTAPSPVKPAIVDRKRKLLPKVALKMPAGSAEAAESNTPPDDGHTWRKYGQKEILGARYPRSYYRCTHKTDVGCPAVKQVQRCDEDGSSFDVIYKGYHTCRSAEIDRECWPLAFSQGLISSFLNFPNSTINKSNSSGAPSPNSGATCNNISPAGTAAASLMLANAAARNMSAAHTASLDSLQDVPHQLRHASTCSVAFPFNVCANADLSGSPAQLVASSAKRLSAAECNSAYAYAPANAPLIYLDSVAQQPVMSGGAPYQLHPPPLLFNDFTHQDPNWVPQLKRITATSSCNYHDVGSGNYIEAQYYGSTESAQEQRLGRGDWHDFDSREIYKRPVLKGSSNVHELATTTASCGISAPHGDDHQRLPQEAVVYGSLNRLQQGSMKPSACNNLQQVTMITCSSTEVEQQAATIPSPRPSPNTTSCSQQPQIIVAASSAAALTFDTCMQDNDDLLAGYLEPNSL